MIHYTRCVEEEGVSGEIEIRCTLHYQEVDRERVEEEGVSGEIEILSVSARRPCMPGVEEEGVSGKGRNYSHSRI